MHFAALLLPLTLGLSATAELLAVPASMLFGVSPARQFRRSVGNLAERDTEDLDPELVCGASYKDCGDGWCCTASQQCAANKLEGFTVCNDPTVTVGLVRGTAVAMPYKDLDEKLASVTKAVAAATGAAVANGMDGIGSTVALVAGVWGAAAAGGAGLMFL